MMNEYQSAIEVLVQKGHTVLQIVMSDNSCLYFTVYKWQEGYFNTAQSIDFNTVQGVNITDFLVKNSAQFHNDGQFISHFENYLTEAPVVRCEFSKTSLWYKWQIA